MRSNGGEPSVRRVAPCRSVRREPPCRSVRRRRCLENTRAKIDPLCQQGDISEGARFDFDRLPEDILCHIHSLFPLRDAACLAGLSHRFLRSWRSFPNLTLNHETFNLNIFDGTPFERAKKLVDRFDNILHNHSGTGVKTLDLDVSHCVKLITADHINNWLHAAVKPGILEIAMTFPVQDKPMFNFSCSLLSSAGSSLQSVSFFACGFHPTLRTGCFKSLRSVYFKFVHITSEELGCLLFSTVSLEKLEISRCDQLTFLNIPSHLEQLSTLHVLVCQNLQLIEIYAPKLTTFCFRGPPIKILTSDSSHLKHVSLSGVPFNGMIQYATAILHSIASNLETLNLASSKEAFSTIMLPEKFLHLRNLNINFDGIRFQRYDYFPLASFLEACPALESFYIWAGEYDLSWKDPALQDSNADSLQIRRIPEFRHANLKKVSITRFFPSKSLIELTYLIIENASSLECLTLDTGYGFDTSGVCRRMNKFDVIQALSGVEAAKRYIEGKVPSSVKFTILEPCKRCHIPKLYEL
uniref:At1g61320/AtMIF1 LRR domain-containing protein n=1 Tax=Leersia perrieri TaxID=77586 RepID=A0A0D9XGQ6_9ORYZ